ncbi:TetR/AcrR family transcriptional regulator [Rhizobium sp. BE258]|uniref:TetR/AcrR family transcriptional regulator n=1 Tax=Rhizobium sp. BE258 TaxID=2817722 RepID=UPI000DDA04AF|nr:TetR/AcrR family transcriptional regulator [Rhizobium sp. BE258]MDR7145047.1 TetR/AcrR family transcriptional repressor of nem operon [Rhizobium sp. BE258]
MRYPAHETEEKHQRILEEAGRAFRSKGFDGVSINDIMKATGLTHGPFYNHFPSKASLAREVIARTTAQLQQTLKSLAASGGNSQIYEYYVSADHRDEPQNGCVLAACGPEIARDTDFREIAAEHIDKVVEQLASGIKSDSPEEARQGAITQFATMVGSVVLARACSGHQLSDELLANVLRSLGSPLQETKKRRTAATET